jgi:hypothetical protein
LCIKIWFRLGAKIGDFDRVCTFKNLIWKSSCTVTSFYIYPTSSVCPTIVCHRLRYSLHQINSKMFALGPWFFENWFLARFLFSMRKTDDHNTVFTHLFDCKIVNQSTFSSKSVFRVEHL